jgi:hypothetical protein
MHFCIYCGAGVTPEAEKKRVSNPLTWRSCIRCGQTDELNQNFCIFCSGKISVPGEVPADSNAYRKFSWELEQIDTSKAMDRVEAEAPRQQPAKLKPRKRPKNNKAVLLAVVLGLLGAMTGAGFAFLVGQAGLQRIVLQSTTWQNKHLVIYTTVPYATLMIEDGKKQVYTVTQTGADGALEIAELPPGQYTLYLSAQGYSGVKTSFPIQEHRTTVLGFPKRIELPKKRKDS